MKRGHGEDGENEGIVRVSKWQGVSNNVTKEERDDGDGKKEAEEERRMKARRSRKKIR